MEGNLRVMGVEDSVAPRAPRWNIIAVTEPIVRRHLIIAEPIILTPTPYL